MYIDENMLREQTSKLVLSCNNKSVTKNEMDTTAIVGDGIEYKGELQQELMKLNEELKEIEEEECKENAELKSSKLEIQRFTTSFSYIIVVTNKSNNFR
ncbi:hypothetical protein Dsin_004693 [Dipteronia sinensis]|uniref:Uncharacterized protein n=1 Tax=Dipteronia sinensis TaxID=43782 RepID=A0AAE0AV18_9ROSI|nr:hypothetical protein Dsin_004693 [Dipteronia sinensis]